MSVAIQVSVTLTEINCGQCGGVYAINERYRQQCYDYGRSWNCPYCQTGWGWSGKGALQIAEQNLAAEKQRHTNTLSRLNETQSERDKIARKLKRVDRGVCPDCNRTFANLSRHMNGKHKGAP